MRVFRLSRKEYAHELSGAGAARFGNRWNSKGVEIIYTSESKALAMAEVLVHLNLNILPKDFMMIEVDIPDNISLETLDINLLPSNWNAFPHQQATQKLGDRFIYTHKNCVLQVPSVVVKGNFNYLINPRHAEFSTISIIESNPFPFDKRFFIA